MRRHTGLALFVALALLSAGARAELDAPERALRDAVFERRAEAVETLARWADHNTGSLNRPGLEAFARQLGVRLEALGFEVALEAGATLALPGRAPLVTGPLVLARRRARTDDGAAQFLLQGHMDTVFEPESPFQKFRRDPGNPGRATGPGVADMKGGLVVLFTMLEALAERGELDGAGWTVLLNADEELGSLGSRVRIETEARRATVGLVFEAKQAGAAMVRSRRGLGQFHLEVTGMAAHAGSAHEKGRSAIRELAAKVLRIEALTDYGRGITLNVGTFEGGTKRNIVPERATAWVDLRYDDVERGEQMRRRIEAIAAETFVPGTETRLWGTLHRPPKPADDATDRLLAIHARAARDLGVANPEPLHAGGGTDGSLMNAVGLPTLDTMGAVGGHAHTDLEFIELDSLTERAALAAVLARRILRGEGP